MMNYQLAQPLGNNAFSYHERKALGSDCSLVISDPCEITSLDQVELGNFVVFEEYTEDAPLVKGGIEGGFGMQKGIISCTGLAHTYILKPQHNGHAQSMSLHKNPTIIITDNHNHVLPYRLDFIAQHKGYAKLVSDQQEIPEKALNNIRPLPGGEGFGVRLVHIDQHSDLGPNPNTLDLGKIFAPSLQEEGSGGGFRNFAHHECNIGNFITPCIQSGLITNMTQVRTEYKLNEISALLTSSEKLFGPLVCDIDLDFRAPEMGFHYKPGGTLSMGISNIHKTMDQVRSIMAHADLITIATSPYFIDQTLALQLLHQLLGPYLTRNNQ